MVHGRDGGIVADWGRIPSFRQFFPKPLFFSLVFFLKKNLLAVVLSFACQTQLITRSFQFISTPSELQNIDFFQ